MSYTPFLLLYGYDITHYIEFTTLYMLLLFQLVSDANNNVLALEERLPGSNHDAYVLFNSDLHRFCTAGGMENYWLLGDSGLICIMYSCNYGAMNYYMILPIINLKVN